MSISRGGNSVLEKLHQENIPAEDYISFYSLRNWGRIKKSSAAKMVSPMASGILLDPSSPTSTTTGSGIDASRKGSMDQATNGMYGGFNNSVSNINTSSIATTSATTTTNKPISKKKSKIRNSVSSLTNMRNGGDSGGGGTNDDSSQHPSTQHQRQRSRSNSEDRWDTMSDGRMEFVTEQVYIHSKLMIVDDKTVICGSGKKNTLYHAWTHLSFSVIVFVANLNDR